MEGVVDAIEIVKDPRHGSDFDNLTFVEVAAQLGKRLIANVVGVPCEVLGEFERRPLARAEVRRVSPFETRQFFLRRSEPPCQGGVRA